MSSQQKNRTLAKKIAQSLSNSLSNIFGIPQGSTSSSGNESSDQISQTSTGEVEGVDPGSEDNATPKDKDHQISSKTEMEDDLDHGQALQAFSQSQHVRQEALNDVITKKAFNQEAHNQP